MSRTNKALPFLPIESRRSINGAEFRVGYWIMIVIPPDPGVAEPERGQHMQWRCMWTAICSTNADEDIFGIDFGILNGDIEVTILRKNAAIDQFVFGFTSSATTVLCHQFSVGEGMLRIFIQRLHIGMCRSTVKKVIVLLH